MTSSRFPGKVLALLRGEPVLEHVLRAAEAVVHREAVIVATSDDRTDDAIEAFVRQRGTAIVRGDLDNVLSRFQTAAKAHPSDWVLRITADSPMLNPDVLRALIRAADTSWDLITTTWPRTFPIGWNAELIRHDVLVSIDASAANAHEREHVTAYFYNRPTKYRIKNIECEDPAFAALNLAVDEPGDLVRLERMNDAEFALMSGQVRG